MAEWYMISWNAEVSRVFFRRCFAFSSVKHPSENLDPGRAGSLPETGSLLREFRARSAVMYSAGSDDQPKSGVHQLEEEALRRFGSGRWDPEALGRIETGLKDVRGVAMAMVDHRLTMQVYAGGGRQRRVLEMMEIWKLWEEKERRLLEHNKKEFLVKKRRRRRVMESSNGKESVMSMQVNEGMEVNEGIEESNFESNEIERNKMGIMRALVEREDPSSKDVDDFMIRRFLRARDLDIEKASNLFLKYLSWRKSFVPNGSISESEIPRELAHNKLFMQGLDKTGRPIVVVFGGRHKRTKLEEFKRFVVYSLDKISARMPAGKEKFVSIADLEGWGYVNSDIRGYLAALSILQDCYPERLGKLYLVHVPYVFMTAWKMVYPFIDNKTKKKIVFVENKKLSSMLLSDIDESQLPDTYGGKLPLVPIQDC